MNLKNYRELLNIPYIKLHFRVELLEDCVLPRSKTSALRGGIGQMLILQNCILSNGNLNDSDCKACDCLHECLVQRFLYTPMDIEPSFKADKLSMGYVIECENYFEEFAEGDSLEFCVILFGKSRVYFNLLMQAVQLLGQAGLGKSHGRFQISQVLNSKKQPILIEGKHGVGLYKERYETQILADYVDYRLEQMGKHGFRSIIKFQSETALKYQNELQDHFSKEAILSNLLRRIYLYNCFCGKEMDFKEMLEKGLEEELAISHQEIRKYSVKRYSSRKDKHMYFSGIQGSVYCEYIAEDLLPYLLAGEILHIGKNTSFGFGRYRMF